MPAITTHYSFALEMGKLFPSPFPQARYLGAQGPDPFFFYGQLPWKKRPNKKGVDAYGSLLHHIDIAPIYAAFLTYASAQGDKELLFAYIEGLFLHYVLDRDCHPYIFPKAGFSALPEEKAFYSASHCEFETYLDFILGHEKGTFTYDAARYLKLPKEQLHSISKMWFEVNKTTLQDPSLKEDSFFLATKDYAATLRFVNVPHGCKKVLIPLLLGKTSLPYAMLLPSKIPAEAASIDFLNSQKKPWPNVVTGELRNESFAELWEQAHQDFAFVYPLLQKGEAGEEVGKALSSFTRNIDHDGVEPGQTMAFMDVAWPQGFIKKKK